MTTLKKQIHAGFTLIEIMLVVTAMAILGTVVVTSIKPGVQLGETRNAERSTDIKTILDAIYQYAVANEGNFPSTIAQSSSSCGSVPSHEICYNTSCSGLTDLAVLTTSQRFLAGIPRDPKIKSGNGTGYSVVRTTNDRIIVCATQAENAQTISVMK